MSTPAEAAHQRLSSNLNYPDELPIVGRRDELVRAIADHQVLIVAGETGSGKSTQLPKLCIEAGRGLHGIIGHTQPRRLAARSIGERIAEETRTELGREVGYTVRFNDRTSDATRIKVMTDGILLAELQRDRRLSRYDTIVVDEAHERSLNIDFILGYLKNLLPRRPDLHVIITSATIDTERFASHFDDAPVIEVSGRSFPVELRYRPLDGPERDEPVNQIDGICEAVEELAREGPGDMLVFLAGERDIREAAEAVDALNLPDTETFPLFARLSAAEQHRVFRSHKGRRVVLATNVAETSVTVPGIRYVIDPGEARISRYNQRTKVQRLPIEAVSQASADQRAGRCGRIGPGICVRLYSEDDYLQRPEFTDPEIHRTNLASVILQMASLGLGDIAAFPFVDPPDQRSITDGVRLLEELDALDPDHQFEPGWLTPIGRELAKLPVDPRFGRMIVEAADQGALAEVLVIVAGMSIQDPRERPTDAEQQAIESHRRFEHERSDFLTLLNLWRYLQKQRKKRSSNQFRRMCHSEFLHYNRIREWQDTHRQLRQTVDELGYTSGSNKAAEDTVHRAILAGLLSQVGLKDAERERRLDRQAQSQAAGKPGRSRQRRGLSEFLGTRNTRFVIGRRSVLASAPPNWVMAAELIETNRLWATMCAPIDPSWVEPLADHLLTRSYSTPTWNPERGVATCVESVTLYGLPLISGRRITVGRVNPELARELFIHHALVEGDWETDHGFVNHNRELIADFAELEARSRRRDLLVEAQRLHQFFDRRLPDHIESAGHFNKWWKKASRDDPERLNLRIEDLMEANAAPIDPTGYPDTWPLGDGSELELAYEFDAASHLDGVSVHVPVEVLPQLDADRFSWSIPGLRTELLAALIRSLPKDKRKPFTPIADTAAAAAERLSDDGTQSVTQALARDLGRRSGVVLESADFDWDRVPEHLVPTFRVINADRELLAEGKDLGGVTAALAELTEQAVSELTAAETGLERTGLRTWDLGDLPIEVVTESPHSGGLHQVIAYPSLVDDGDSVSVRFLTSPDDQADQHWAGVRRLLQFQLRSPLRRLDDELAQSTKLDLLNPPVQSKAAWYTDAVEAALDAVLEDFGPPPLTAEGFQRLVDHADKTFEGQLAAVADAVDALVERCQQVSDQLDSLADASFSVSVDDAAAHYRRLAYEGFIAAVGLPGLDDVVTSLDGLSHRLEKLPENPRVDLERAAVCVEVEQRLRRLVDQLGPVPELLAAAWRTDDLRLATFAPQFRPDDRPKVSAQRVQRELSAAAAAYGL